jgi:acetylornithine/succinyldiaminopimelate/putrescine aminotransferase
LRKSQYQKKGSEIVENAILTPFGKEIKKRLVDIDRTQAWLIEQVQGTTGLYFDRSYMHKIQTGQLATPKIIQAIRDILDLPEQRQDTKVEG